MSSTKERAGNLVARGREMADTAQGWAERTIFWQVWERLLENEFVDRSVALASKAFVSLFPLLLVFLMLVGVLNTQQLRRSRRWTAVGITVFAAVITPSADPFSMLFMAIPMYIFFEISILIGRVMKR